MLFPDTGLSRDFDLDFGRGALLDFVDLAVGGLCAFLASYSVVHLLP